MSRVSAAGLLRLANDLGEGERTAVDIVARLRLVSHAQLAALLAPAHPQASVASTARAVRRTLARLTGLGVLARLERRVGGVRAGSAGYVYYLGPVGQRLIAYWEGRGLIRGRFRPEPGGRYVRHRLAVSELYVQLRLADRAGELDLLAFEAEPDCWRRSLDGFGGSVLLKPDAFVRLGVGAYEDRCFVEVDLGTESRSVIASKVQAYLDYFHAGAEQAEHGVFPRVVLLTNTEVRRAVLVDVVTRLPAEYWELFTIATLDRALEVLSGQAVSAGRESQGDGSWS
jgi:protein involved in plasmid replication-relaxation